MINYNKMNEIIIEKSKFITYSFDLFSTDKIKDILLELKKEHRKATHICFAYVYKKEVVLEKCSDDGEPSGTAGLPILNVIKKKGLQNIMVVVVRYFGGKKLGAGGLVRAYTKSASFVL